MRATVQLATRSDPATRRHRATGGPVHLRPASALASTDVLQLQRTAGNQAVQRLVGGALRVGSRGPDVVALQQKLNAAGASLTADGAFGTKTQQAVMAYQRAADLGADGVVGPKTNAALDGGTVRIGTAASGAVAGGGDSRLRTLGGILQAIKAKLERRGAAGAATAPPALTEPVVRAGLFDDVADWVDEQVDGATEAVADAASGAQDWVEEKVEAATDWVGDQVESAGAAVDTVGEAIGEAVDAAGEAIGGAAAAIVEGAKELAGEVQTLVSAAVEELGEKGADLIRLLGDLAGGLAPSGASLDDLITKATAVLAGLGEVTDELKGAAAGGTGTLDFKTAAGSNPDFVFSDPTFHALQVRLTARTQEMGSALPSTPSVTFNGKANPPSSDETVSRAVVSVTETVQLPSWTNANSAAVQPAQKAEWERYLAAMSAHEQLHVADDRGIYEAMAKSLPGKTFAEAYAAVDAATEAGNNKGPVRDGSNPPPRLNPAGVEKQP